MMNNNKYMYVKVQMVIYMYLTESHEMFSVSVFRAEHYLEPSHGVIWTTQKCSVHWRRKESVSEWPPLSWSWKR